MSAWCIQWWTTLTCQFFSRKKKHSSTFLSWPHSAVQFLINSYQNKYMYPKLFWGWLKNRPTWKQINKKVKIGFNLEWFIHLFSITWDIFKDHNLVLELETPWALITAFICLDEQLHPTFNQNTDWLLLKVYKNILKLIKT